MKKYKSIFREADNSQTIKAELYKLKRIGINNPVFDKKNIKGSKDPDRKGKIDVFIKTDKGGFVYLHSTERYKTVKDAVQAYIDLMLGNRK